jgi:hypothetical protein
MNNATKNNKNDNIFENGRQPQIFKKGRRPQFFENGRRPQINNTTKKTIKSKIIVVAPLRVT